MNLPVRRPNAEGLRSGDTHIHQGGSRFGSTQVTGGSVFQGNFNGVTINSTARPDFAGQFSHSSLEPVKAYVPRISLRDEIKTQLWDNAAYANTKTLVVWGLGGAGKTQLVLDYVRQYRTDYKATFWIEAGRKESLERDFVNLYQTLFGVQMIAGQETVSVDSAVIGVKSWFSSQRGPWLIVFDGADLIENEEVTEYIDIKRFIPNVASLHIIVTSRSSTAKDMTQLEGVQVGDMEEAQAAELFYKYSRLRRDNRDIEHEVRVIVKELGYLALAVTLASTYVGRTPRLQSDVKAYLPEYRQRRRELLKRKPESLIHQYSNSVLTTWETSYHAIHEQNSEASTLMTMLSFFSFDDIFLQLFGTSRQLESTRSKGSAIKVSSTPTEDIYKLEGCFEILQRYSFVQWKEDQQSYAMHKLVHAWGYDRLTEDERHEFSATTFKLVMKAINGCGNTPEEKLRLVPHIMANFAMLGDTGRAWDQAADGTLNELVLAGVFIANIGRLPEGRVIQEFIWNEKRRLLGEEHPDTTSAMYNLAVTLRYQGQLDEAAKMMKEALEKRRHILGEEHRDTILVMSNLATTLRNQGQLDEAAKMQKEVLEKSMRVLGEEHLDTISALGNLAVTLGIQGQLDEAVKMEKKTFKKTRRILGEEHPYTMSAMSNLAKTLRDQGQLDEAAKMQKEVLEKMRRILGDKHPSIILAMNNLAATLEDQGQLDEVAKIKKEVLENRRRILGEEHLDTILAMDNLAKTLGEQWQLGDQGQLDEAAKIKKEVLEKRRRILGEEHPDTMSAMSNLASTLKDQGQVVEAAKMFKEVFEKMRLILGEEHPLTIIVTSNLAQALRDQALAQTPRDQGQLDEAAKMMKEALEKMRRILGEEHPDTVLEMSNLAETLGDQGQLDEAITLSDVAVQKMKRIHGNKHPHTIFAIRTLTQLTASKAIYTAVATE